MWFVYFIGDSNREIKVGFGIINVHLNHQTRYTLLIQQSFDEVFPIEDTFNTGSVTWNIGLLCFSIGGD